MSYVLCRMFLCLMSYVLCLMLKEVLILNQEKIYISINQKNLDHFIEVINEKGENITGTIYRHPCMDKTYS